MKVATSYKCLGCMTIIQLDEVWQGMHTVYKFDPSSPDSLKVVNGEMMKRLTPVQCGPCIPIIEER